MTTKPGEVYRADLGYAGKVRMMVVVSIADPNAPRVLTVCVPITKSYRQTWYEISLGPKAFLREPSYVNVQGLVNLGHHELEGIGRLHPAEMDAIRTAIARMIEIK